MKKRIFRAQELRVNPTIRHNLLLCIIKLLQRLSFLRLKSVDCQASLSPRILSSDSLAVAQCFNCFLRNATKLKLFLDARKTKSNTNEIHLTSTVEKGSFRLFFSANFCLFRICLDFLQQTVFQTMENIFFLLWLCSSVCRRKSKYFIWWTLCAS